MGLVDGERLVRVFADSFELVGGVSLFDGVPFSGVGVAVEESGRCSFLRYAEGVEVGPFVEPLVDGDQSLLVFDDDSEQFLSENALGVVRFEGEPFKGFTVHRRRDDSRFLQSLVGFESGSCTEESVEWHANGQLEFFKRNQSSIDVGWLVLKFGWYADGSPAASSLRVRLSDNGYGHSSTVDFDELGRLTTVSITPWDLAFEQVGEARIRELARDRVFLRVEELHGFRAGRALWLSPHNTSGPDLDVLMADNGMEEVEELTCYISSDQLPRVLALPHLRMVKFARPHPPTSESRVLLEEWQAAAPGRELRLPD